MIIHHLRVVFSPALFPVFMLDWGWGDFNMSIY